MLRTGCHCRLAPYRNFNMNKIRGQIVLDPKERIQNLSVVNKHTGCWEWIGSVKGKSKLRQYGSLIVGSRTDGSRRTISAHRYSYSIFKGDIPKGLFVCHKCDNPRCVNPEHLFLGTRQDNVDDREDKGRNNHVVGEEVPTSKLTESQVMEIRSKYQKGGYTHRQLANEYGLKNHTSIGDILRGKIWKHLLPEPPKED